MAFPELVLTGYPPEDLLFKLAFIEANLRALADVAARSRGLTAVVGFVDKRDDIWNAAAVLHDGVHAGTYHKQYLPNYGVFDENRYFQSGTESPGVLARRHDDRRQHLRGHLVSDGADDEASRWPGAELVVCINASPYHAGKARSRERMLATRAADDQVCLAFVNTVGGQDELVFDGQSFVFNEKWGADRTRPGLPGGPGRRGRRSGRGVPRPAPRLAPAEGEAAGRRGEPADRAAPAPAARAARRWERRAGARARGDGGDLRARSSSARATT